MALAAALLAANLALTLRLQRLLLAQRAEERKWQQWLTKEVSLHGPTKAAIAAVLAVSKEQPLQMEEFQREVLQLQDQWDKIEALAEQACARLAELMEEEPGRG